MKQIHPWRIAIIGAGVWGKALASLAVSNGHEVKVWSRSSPSSLAATLAGAEIVLSAVSMAGVKEVVAQAEAINLSPEAVIVSATKGLALIEGESTPVFTASQFWHRTFAHHPIVVLSGPNLSEEIQRGLPAASVAASTQSVAAQTVQTIFSSPNFRVYTNPDPQGVELGGTLKNIIAIAVGCCDALQLGANAKAALVTRGLSEMIRVGTHWGANPETFYGLAGLGDLLATCNSPLSRNYQVGFGLAQGKNLIELLSTLTGTAEGINTTRVLVEVANHQGISVPISQQVYRLINGEITPQAAVEALMLREVKPEYNSLT